LFVKKSLPVTANKISKKRNEYLYRPSEIQDTLQARVCLLQIKQNIAKEVMHAVKAGALLIATWILTASMAGALFRN
jgi:hypothetical protein